MDAATIWPATLAAVRTALQHEGSVGLIVPDSWAHAAAEQLSGAGVAFALLSDSGPADATGADLVAEQAGHHGSGPGGGPPRVSVVPATTAKGLEYDHVVVLEPAQIAADEPDLRTGLRRLYVVLTRAVSGLEVVHARPLPGPLAD